MMKRIATALIFVIVIALSVQTKPLNTEKIYQQIKADYTKLTKSPSARTKRSNWEKIIQRFLVFWEKYPNSDRADDALFMAGRMRFELFGYSSDERDLDRAIKNFQRVVKNYPKSNLADDALYYTGLCYEKKKWKQNAYQSYEKIVKKYPKGDMASRARAKLESLKKYQPPKTAQFESKKQTSQQRDAKTNWLFDVRCWTNPLYSRVVIYLSKNATYEISSLPADEQQSTPAKIIVDINEAIIASDVLAQQEIPDGLISHIRVAQHTPIVSRVVVDLRTEEEYQHFFLTNPFRIVLDIGGEMAEFEERDIETVIIDPGHGGHDPGAQRFGINEKDMVLQLSKILKSKLEERTDLEIFTTRDSDVFIPLEARTAFANQRGGDIFISLHVNAARNPDACGLEIFYLSPARNQEELELAALENNSSVADVESMSRLLQVADIMLTAKIEESEILANTIGKRIKSTLTEKHDDISDRGVKRAPFYVLAGAQMPAVLVEIGFLSNQAEAKMLTDPKRLDAIAEGIAEGVLRYIRDYEGE